MSGLFCLLLRGHRRGRPIEIAERVGIDAVRIASAYRCSRCGAIVDDPTKPHSLLQGTAGAMKAEQRRMEKAARR